VQTAAYFTSGYDATTFATESADTSYLALPGGFFDRTAAANPFRDYSYVYVPYCTGDIHAGDSVTTLGTATAHFVGYANLTAYLARLVPTFPSASSIVLAGSSAGGFGALYNWDHVQAAFPGVPMTLIDDSGTLMPPDILSKGFGQSAQAAAWNTAATQPPGCTGCAADFDALYDYYAQEFPTARASLLSYVQDSTLPSYYGIAEADFETGLSEEMSNNLGPSGLWRTFTDDASGHVLWFSPQLASAGVTVQDFVTQQVTADAGWTNVP
jgi:hypothetical protein